MPDLKPAGNDGGERELSKVIERSLAAIEIFSDLDPEALKRLSETCRWRRYRRGERIIEQGSESREVLFITEGSVSILVPSPTGREVAFASLGPGNHIGELAAIDGEPRSASAVALGDTTIAIMPSDRFLRLLQDDGRVALKLLHTLSRMVRNGDIRIIELSTLAATQRVYTEILRLAVPDAAVPGLWVVRPLPPLRQIASHISTTRETVARTLSALYQSGLLRRKGRNLYIMDRPAFEKLINVRSRS